MPKRKSNAVHLHVHENVRLVLTEKTGPNGRRRGRAAFVSRGVPGPFAAFEYNSSLVDEPMGDHLRREALRLLAKQWGMEIAIRTKGR